MSADPAIDFSQLLQKSATVQITLADGTQRPFNGIMSAIRQKETTAEDLFVYEATLVPMLWLLSFREDCRIFQSQSVPDIITTILSEVSITKRMPTSWPSQRTYAKRDYCVQYRETSLNFISRLMEEEGIFYYFEHTTSAHTIVFTDASVSSQACPNQAEVAFSYSEEGWRDDDDGIRTLERLQQLHTEKVTFQDYNFETPSNNLLVNAPGTGTVALSATGFLYDYPGEYLTTGDGNTYAGIRIEEREADSFIIRGESRCRAFQPGYKFTLQKHFRPDTNQDYVLLSVTHDAVDSTFRTSQLAAAKYGNSYVAIPKSIPYRPPRVTPKPLVRGVQTAIIVGPAGEEIYVDKYGRVKVQFYWDRVGTKNENSSCWIRVAQIWAGKNWGWITIPRIGQEVIVDFLEGDPDKPIITGRVYNAEMMPPYALPDNQTQSGIVSRSSKQGSTDNFNEIRFEDLKGSEEIHINAEKDMSTVVEHDDTQTIQNDRTITVKGKHTETITKDTTITIDEGNHSLTLNQGNQSVELKQGNRSVTLDVGNETVELKQGDQSTTLDMGNQSTTLKMGNQSTELNLGNQSTKVDLGSISMEAMQSITLKVGMNSITIDQTGVTVKGIMVTVEGEAITSVKGDAMLQMQGGITMIN
jgi:type VI secretion system secreted protein VgrG